MPRTRTPRQWREILDAFDRSNLSQTAFCRRPRTRAPSGGEPALA